MGTITSWPQAGALLAKHKDIKPSVLPNLSFGFTPLYQRVGIIFALALNVGVCTWGAIALPQYSYLGYGIACGVIGLAALTGLTYFAVKWVRIDLEKKKGGNSLDSLPILKSIINRERIRLDKEIPRKALFNDARHHIAFLKAWKEATSVLETKEAGICYPNLQNADKIWVRSLIKIVYLVIFVATPFFCAFLQDYPVISYYVVTSLTLIGCLYLLKEPISIQKEKCQNKDTILKKIVNEDYWYLTRALDYFASLEEIKPQLA